MVEIMKKSVGNGVISSAVNSLATEMEGEMMEKQSMVDQLVQEIDETDSKTAKVESKTSKVGPKKRKVGPKKSNEKSKGGDIMNKDLSPRQKAEALLMRVCKEMGIRVQRIQPKRDIQHKPGALQAVRADGLKVAVRAGDVCIYSPYSVIKVGRPEVGGYPHVTILRHSEPEMEVALRRALKDKKSNAQWAAELKATRRTKTLETIEQRRVRLEAELKALKETEKSMKKKEVMLKKLKPQTV